MRLFTATRALRALTVLSVVVCVGSSAPRALAQGSPAGTLRVTVVDPSGAIIVGATVTVTGGEPGRGRCVHRDHHAGWPWTHPLQHLLSTPGRIRKWTQPVCAHQGP